jgi:dipeptidyl aminopeptidase/acylaminoacyl peptidase
VAVERQLVTLTADDGERHDALLEIDERAARHRERASGRRTAVVHVHGIMGNFLVGTLRFLPAPLARAGFPVLVCETRMGNVGQLFGSAIFDESIRDIEAGVRWLRAEGYDHVVLSGYSSGATLATRYAATHATPDLRGLLCFGNPWGLPQSLERRSRRWGAQPPYDQIVAEVRTAIGHDPNDEAADRLFVIDRSRGPTEQPRDGEVYTYRTWWTSRGPSATAAMAFRQIGQVWAPILLVQGTADEVVDPDEAWALADVARRAGNHEVRVAPIAGGKHSFEGREIAALDAATRWLREKG